MIAKWHIVPVLALGLSLLLAGCASSGNQPKSLTGESSQTQTKQIWMGSRYITTISTPATDKP